MALKYWVSKTKVVHKLPVPNGCNAKYDGETTYDTKEEAYKHADEYCDNCFTELKG